MPVSVNGPLTVSPKITVSANAGRFRHGVHTAYVQVLYGIHTRAFDPFDPLGASGPTHDRRAGLITLTIGVDGIPVEETEVNEHSCVMVDTINLAEIDLSFWAILGRDFDHRFAVHENTHIAIAPLSLISPSRAPPVLI